MPDLKISQLPSASLPLAGTEVLPIVQSGTTKKVAVDDLFPSQAGNSGKFLTTDGTDISWATISSNPIVITPTNVSPATGSTGIFPGQVLSATAFFALYGYTFANAQWQVSTSSGFGTTVFDSGTSGAAVTSITISDTYIDESTTYYWRVRYKASDGSFSSYSTAFTFTTAASFVYPVEYLVLAGGGAGGSRCGGGGGSGGLLYSTSSTVSPATSYSITVGAGGAGNTWNVAPSVGGNSSFGAIATATGGGYGGGGAPYGSTGGGSGGGGSGSSQSGSAGTVGQGNAGGAGISLTLPDGGGGGGPAASGTAATGNGGNGGAGTAYSISGSSVTYGGGGGGGTYVGDGSAGSGGSGNGANGTNTDTTPSAAPANGGGGGGGSGYSGSGFVNGGSGGSGVVIISYAGTTPIATGGTITTSGGRTIHTFTSSGTFAVT